MLFENTTSTVLDQYLKPTLFSISKELRRSEASWHYSVHYLTECVGEELIENMQTLVTKKSHKKTLDYQLRDEIKHVRAFKGVVDTIGLNPLAGGYAEGVRKMVLAQESLSEKIFVFQILVEAVSAAYCDWRKQVYIEPLLQSVDEVVFKDEERHLKMGHSILSTCDRNEWDTKLTPERRKKLIHEINSICMTSIREQMPMGIVPEDLQGQLNIRSTSLDRTVIRSIISEVAKITPPLRLHDSKEC